MQSKARKLIEFTPWKSFPTPCLRPLVAINYDININIDSLINTDINIDIKGAQFTSAVKKKYGPTLVFNRCLLISILMVTDHCQANIPRRPPFLVNIDINIVLTAAQIHGTLSISTAISISTLILIAIGKKGGFCSGKSCTICCVFVQQRGRFEDLFGSQCCRSIGHKRQKNFDDRYG